MGIESKFSAWRFTTAMRINAAVTVSGALSPETRGVDNLELIDRKRPIMVVTTHLSDVDVQMVAGVLGRLAGFDMAVANQSTQFDGSDKLIHAGIKLAGEDRFVPLGWVRNRNRQPVTWFRQSDYDQTDVVFEQGRALVVAGHNPTFGGKLASRPGYAAAEIILRHPEVQILPVAVDMTGDPPNSSNLVASVLGRGERKARVVIGRLFEGRSLVAAGTEQEDHYDQLRRVGDELMCKLAELLPDDKQGSWRGKC